VVKEKEAVGKRYKRQETFLGSEGQALLMLAKARFGTSCDVCECRGRVGMGKTVN